MLVLDDHALCCDVMEQQPRIPVDEKYLVHPVSQSMEQDHLCERAAGSPRFQSPLEPRNERLSSSEWLKASVMLCKARVMACRIAGPMMGAIASTITCGDFRTVVIKPFST